MKLHIFSCGDLLRNRGKYDFKASFFNLEQHKIMYKFCGIQILAFNVISLMLVYVCFPAVFLLYIVILAIAVIIFLAHSHLVIYCSCRSSKVA